MRIGAIEDIYTALSRNGELEFDYKEQPYTIQAEFVDDKPLYAPPVLFGQQHNGSVQLGKNAAPIDVRNKKNGRICHLSHTHIDNVVLV